MVAPLIDAAEDRRGFGSAGVMLEELVSVHYLNFEVE